MKEKLAVVFSLLILTVCVFACGGGSSSGCSATLNYEGEKFTGEGKSEDEAKRFACNKYCREADPEYDAMYRIWLDSPAGKNAGKPSKEEAIFKDKKLMDFVTATCANKCLDNIKSGKFKAESSCK